MPSRQAPRRQATAIEIAALIVGIIGAFAGILQVVPSFSGPAAYTPVGRSPVDAPTGWHIQLAALTRHEQIETEYRRILARSRELLRAADKLVVYVPGEPNPIKLRAGTFAARQVASRICEELKTRQQDCFVVPANGRPARCSLVADQLRCRPHCRDRTDQ